MSLKTKLNRYGYARMAMWLIVAVGALNWGLVELVDYNVVTQLLPADWQGIVYLVVGAAGALNLADLVFDLEVL